MKAFTMIPTLPPLRTLALALVLTITSTVLHAQVPGILNYQGRVAVGDPPVNFEGSGAFKFALVNANGTTSYWSNDGTEPPPTPGLRWNGSRRIEKANS
jgi:hypothetical protein